MPAKGTRRRERPHPGEGARLFSSMRITVNGQPIDVADALTVEGLLERLAVKRQYTAVAVNRDVTPKSQYGTLVLRDGDKIEIVRPMGGGR